MGNEKKGPDKTPQPQPQPPVHGPSDPVRQPLGNAATPGGVGQPGVATPTLDALFGAPMWQSPLLAPPTPPAAPPWAASPWFSPGFSPMLGPVAPGPAAPTPAAAPPAVATPAAATPAAATPAAATPAVATPAVATPAVATPAVATPAVATPAAPRVDPTPRGREIAATVQEALRSEWFGKRVDPQAAIAALNGQPPEVLAAARAQYRQQTGRNLEDDLRSNLSDRDNRAAMGHLWNGMNVSERARYNGDGAAVADALRAPTPTDRELERNDPEGYRRMRLETARNAIRGCAGTFDDDEDEAMQIMTSLSITERRQLIAENPNLVDFMNAEERGRFEAMARSEADTVRSRAEQAMAGAGTDENGLSGSMRTLRDLTQERDRLRQEMTQNPGMTEADRRRRQERIDEIGDIDTLNRVERNDDGSVRGFLGQVESELSGGEFRAHLETLGNRREAAVQGVMNSTGGWFGAGTDEDGVNEAIATLPAADRMAVFNDARVQSRMRGDMTESEIATARSFAQNDIVAMTNSRLDSANGFFSTDETKILRATLDARRDGTAEQQQQLAGRLDGARTLLNADEQRAFDEARTTGTIRLETGMAAATNGLGTNDEMMTLVSERRSQAEGDQIRAGYLMDRQGRAPSNPQEAEALRLFRSVQSTMDGDLSTDDMQSQLDTLIGGATEQERQTPEGRQRAAQILLARQEDKANTISGAFTAFSDTDDTLQTSAIATSAAYNDAMQSRGSISEEDLGTLQTRDETFQNRHKEMLDAQNFATDVAATVVGTIASAAAIFFTAGGATPAVAGMWASVLATAKTTAIVTGLTMLTKAAVGGQRYSGEAMLADAAGGVLGAGTGKLATSAGNLAGGLVRPGITRLATSSVVNGLSNTAMGSVTGSLMDDAVYDRPLDQLATKVLVTDMFTPKNLVGAATNIGTAGLESGLEARSANRRQPPAATTPDPATQAPASTPVTADPAVAPAASEPAPAAATPRVTEATPTSVSEPATPVVAPKVTEPAAAASEPARAPTNTPDSTAVVAELRQAAAAQQDVVAATQAVAQTPDAVADLTGPSAPKADDVAVAKQNAEALTAAADVLAAAPKPESAPVAVETPEQRSTRVWNELGRRFDANDLPPHLVEWVFDNNPSIADIEGLLASHPSKQP